MGIPERSRERVEEYLAGLEETHGSFPVNQTTVSLPAERFRSVNERDSEGWIEAYIEVRNETSEVLHVTNGGDRTLPGVRVSATRNLESRIRQTVERLAGIQCSVDGLERATIAGIRNADDPEHATVYHMVVVFAGRHVGGALGENAEAEWDAAVRENNPLAR